MSPSFLNNPHPSAGSDPTNLGVAEPASPSKAAQVTRNQSPSFGRRVVGFVLGSAGPLGVLLALAGVFAFGHFTDWRMPKFAALTGQAQPVVVDWCDEHSVPESICVECDDSLMAKTPDFGWCAKHGVHNCVLDHPELAQLDTTPEISPEDRERAEWALSMPVSKVNNSGCTTYLKRIQFASVEAVMQAGVDVELVERRPIEQSVSGSGEILYDPTRTASFAARAPGSVWRVEKNVGDRVEVGEVLALVEAEQVGDLKTRLIRALAERSLQDQNVKRLHIARNAVAGIRLLEADADLSKSEAEILSIAQSLENLGLSPDIESLQQVSEREAFEQLRFLGVPESLGSRLKAEVSTANLLPVRASIAGVVAERNVTQGEVVDTHRSLFRIVSADQMWLMLDIPLEDVEQVVVGQKVRFQADGSAQEVVGQVDWISTTADPQTRMVKVRAVLANPQGRLRDKTYGIGRIVLREEPSAIAIPSASVHWEGCCRTVFIRDKNYFNSPESPKVFHVRSVRLGASHDGYTEVIAGVLPGEVIATTGSDVLRAQLLKNGLGAGCCVEE
ncbi:efflux RND transporter periplasmic adaptor subunit [Blastopirellula marina]|uniref:Secretion protein HlyD n=1 Tax=Blastopirellula marina DSM 3645 TaxID=314230 RepID=A3ZMI9_9BACT|nr:efflux RND transporter periplasmic adaptor subunit [Blastopirellula marina]EAQ82162.1 Secretion protein HlyD [Blastopirellula marina DSM 3645]